MKRFAKLTAIFILICMAVSMVSLSAFATGDANVVIGNRLKFEEGNEPFILQERTMMPLRSVSEALGATVYWIGEKKQVQIVCYDTLLSLQIDNNSMNKYKIEGGQLNKENFETLTLEVPPTISNDRTYVPLRAIAEAFDAFITWDNPNRSAIIIPNEKTTNKVSVSEMLSLPDSTLCEVYGVIEKDFETNRFYLRSLTKNESGTYSKIAFQTPENASADAEGDPVTQYWTDLFATDNPSGMVVRYTGVTLNYNGEICAALKRTSTGILSQGYYDTYMKSLGLDYEPFNTIAQ